ncbi:MAG: hypothetical protein P4M00_07460 [Azospirillaceae bacterium]|nr:hypothetical protein [Azospirillaceae bacterium]
MVSQPGGVTTAQSQSVLLWVRILDDTSQTPAQTDPDGAGSVVKSADPVQAARIKLVELLQTLREMILHGNAPDLAKYITEIKAAYKAVNNGGDADIGMTADLSAAGRRLTDAAGNALLMENGAQALIASAVGTPGKGGAVLGRSAQGAATTTSTVSPTHLTPASDVELLKLTRIVLRRLQHQNQAHAHADTADGERVQQNQVSVWGLTRRPAT